MVPTSIRSLAPGLLLLDVVGDLVRYIHATKESFFSGMGAPDEEGMGHEGSNPEPKSALECRSPVAELKDQTGSDPVEVK